MRTDRRALATGSELDRRIICIYAGRLALHVWVRVDYCFDAGNLHDLHAAIAPVAVASGAEG